MVLLIYLPIFCFRIKFLKCFRFYLLATVPFSLTFSTSVYFRRRSWTFLCLILTPTHFKLIFMFLPHTPRQTIILQLINFSCFFQSSNRKWFFFFKEAWLIYEFTVLTYILDTMWDRERL